MGEFLMPSLGADMEHGKVTEWLVAPGDYVHRGDLIAEVDTEKTVMEIETFQEGVVAEFLVDVGETVPVGTPIARITGTPADVAPVAGAHPPELHATPPVRRLAHELHVDLSEVGGTGKDGAITRADVKAAARAGAPHEASDTEPVPPVPPAPVPHEEARRVRSSPRARRMAEHLGLDPAAIEGTGPGGAVTAEDVRRADAAGSAPTASERAPEASAPTSPSGAEPEPEASAPAPSAEPTTPAERLAELHRAVGALMARSKREIPHYYLSTTIDLGAATEWMRQANEGRPVSARLVPTALLLAAAARAAKQVPDVNGFYVDGEYRPSTAVHLGVAVALRGGGLVAPAIHDADALSVDELMERLRDLVARARGGRLRRAEMADPTITVTNLGDLGVETIFGVIHPPQVALIGFGRVVERPVARDGLIGVRPTVVATLSADHRVSDGLAGSRLLARIDELLQEPEEL
ncbi:dihydrolipoamide acetyltransferase component of pyruvate dehydrogenase complex [Agromyces rhizosphaerae]|uniref:Dihydrolipoamide acetyltransferase component of pyruvate dehydrogenase complex n=1 Tax=Agromyces rhizosphaerae TaxID=88374 RepID=A0A9W6D0J2_9MICO|nr:2-oxo acid dehydrogenase subunit E2 [Agromyces rhizosphaerae]GLI28597.1 dihydrolipoamide acetyltransferase component of pyruvate dehydrogenase complex [Agromyces rhizosphaerae]